MQNLKRNIAALFLVNFIAGIKGEGLAVELPFLTPSDKKSISVVELFCIGNAKIYDTQEETRGHHYTVKKQLKGEATEYLEESTISSLLRRMTLGGGQ